MKYLCADCGSPNDIKPREPIRCRECGHRIMYKQRTKRMVCQKSNDKPPSVNKYRYNLMHVKLFRLPTHTQNLKRTELSYPLQLHTYSINSNRSILYNNESLNFYNKPAIGADLKNGYQNALFYDKIEHLDQLLFVIDNLHLDWFRYGVVTFRGLLTKLATVLYNYQDSWSMNAMLIGNTVFLSDSDPPAAPKNEHHRMSMYSGYAFEHYCTSDDPDVRVNTAVQWATINKLRIGSTRILTAGEVDCVDDIPRDRDTYKPSQSKYVELKTSMQIRNQNQQDNFDKKLLKFYFQSYLLGVPKIIVGFKNRDGILVDLKEYSTLDLPQQVKGSAYEWNPKNCTSMAAMLLEFITSTIKRIGRTDKLYKVRYNPEERAVTIEITHLEDIIYPADDLYERYGFIPLDIYNKFQEQATSHRNP
ncbi:RAI1-domain-containing protein [Wallemia mellicola]|uniref:Decapping nuclease n=1 Tax=Wallemia mellicola TaxID=1708541 RepID=A0AB38MU22_9BASI|nr:hypothetical protein E3Q24_02232 [Wallemia mellicola]TIB84186.1 RAI1-domain-containing protein [Wallemia mellicola]TIB87302.1 RAI1-domain-containing protein [Wallemia mellicola]TIC34961.1 RAI1-domain-containing protein [Wallemia mellicola]TIC39908.1 RAI1-domain-containing protein [Wallemia mellicola]